MLMPFWGTEPKLRQELFVSELIWYLLGVKLSWATPKTYILVYYRVFSKISVIFKWKSPFPIDQTFARIRHKYGNLISCRQSLFANWTLQINHDVSVIQVGRFLHREKELSLAVNN